MGFASLQSNSAVLDFPMTEIGTASASGARTPTLRLNVPMAGTYLAHFGACSTSGTIVSSDGDGEAIYGVVVIRDGKIVDKHVYEANYRLTQAPDSVSASINADGQLELTIKLSSYYCSEAGCSLLKLQD